MRYFGLSDMPVSHLHVYGSAAKTLVLSLVLGNRPRRADSPPKLNFLFVPKGGGALMYLRGIPTPVTDSHAAHPWHLLNPGDLLPYTVFTGPSTPFTNPAPFSAGRNSVGLKPYTNTTQTLNLPDL